jgi:hypothetical protein
MPANVLPQFANISTSWRSAQIKDKLMPGLGTRAAAQIWHSVITRDSCPIAITGQILPTLDRRIRLWILDMPRGLVEGGHVKETCIAS